MKSFKQFLAEERKKKLSIDPAFKILDLSPELAAFPEGMSDDEMSDVFWKNVEMQKNNPEYEEFVRAKERHDLHADLEGWDPELKQKIARDYALQKIRREKDVLTKPLKIIEHDKVVDSMEKYADALFADPSMRRVDWRGTAPPEFLPQDERYMETLDNLTSPGRYKKTQMIPNRELATKFMQGTGKAVGAAGKAASALDPVSTAAESGVSKVAGKVAGSVAGMWGLADALFGQEAGRGSEIQTGPLAQEQKRRDELLSAAMNPQEKELPKSKFVPSELKREEFRRKYSR